MATYIEEIVQNIYTNCDMRGLNELNEGTERALRLTKSLSQSLKKNTAGSQLAQDFRDAGYEIMITSKTLKDYMSQSKDVQKSLYDTSRQELNEAKNRERFETFLQKERVKRAEWLDDHAKKRRKYLSQENVLMRNLGRAFLTYFSFRTFKGIVDTASRIQLVQKSIEGLTKSTQDWEFIKTQAFEKGIDLEVVAKGYRNFYSSAKMAGFDKGGIQSMYADMLLSTRAIGASTQQTEGALLALEQMLSKGRVSMEELRRQLGNALPGAFEIGAKAMNMTTAEFNQFIQKVGIASSEFVPKFIAQLKKEYAGGFKDVAETINFATTRVSVAWKLFQTEIFEGEAGKGFAQAIDTIAKLLISPEFINLAKNIGKIFAIVAKLLDFTIKHIHTVLILLGTGGIMAILPKIVFWLKAIGLSLSAIFSTGIIGGITTLTGTLWAMLAPLAAIYAKILLVVTALILLKDVYDTIVHPDWDTLTRREWEGKNTTFGASQSSINPFNRPKTVGQSSEIMESLRNRPAEIYASPKVPNILPALLNKATSTNTNVNIGDVKVTSANANPIQVASEVTKQLVALFTGHGLTVNGEGIVT